MYTYYFHSVLGIGTVFTHFFYIPIILSALWWQRKGIIVTIILSLMLLNSHFLYHPPPPAVYTPFNNYLRVIMFLMVSIVVVSLSEQIERSRKALKAHGDRLEDLVRIRTGELEAANTILESNIRELKNAEAAIKNSEQQIRRIIEDSPVGIRIVQDGRYVYVNSKLVTMFGYAAAEEIIGKPVEALFVPEQAELIRTRGQDRLAGKRVPAAYELQGITPFGDRFEVAVWLTIIDYLGAPAILGFIIDISLEKKLRQQIFQSQKMESMGVMAGGVAHKFNNALSMITGSIDLIKTIHPDIQPIRRYLDAMLNAVDQMVNLNKMLVAFARKGKYWTEEMHLNTVVRETALMIPRQKEETQRIDFELADDLPNIHADPTQVQMVVTAVVQNAIEATGNEGAIRIRTFPETITPETAARNPGMIPGQYVCLQIEDNGTGMNDETRRRIFEPFFTTHFQGRGLGMAAVYGIVKNHNGWVGVESRSGKGTEVSIFLPIGLPLPL